MAVVNCTLTLPITNGLSYWNGMLVRKSIEILFEEEEASDLMH